MRINLPIDYGIRAGVTSLNVIVQNLFLELGKIMNETKEITISATLIDNLAIGDVNMHYDCALISNMGGFRFPPKSAYNVNELYIGLVGIDEIVLGEEVFLNQADWKFNKPIIENEIEKWKKDINIIKKIQVSTESEKEQMIKYLDIPKEKLIVIPYGVNHLEFKPSNDKLKDREFILSKKMLKNQPYFLHVSEKNYKRKNIIRLLDAFEKAKNKGIIHNLIIVGKNLPEVYAYASKISGVIVLGFVEHEELIKLYQCSDALINPSLHEGFGIPILEAMACGIPVITANEYSPPELIKDGGITVDARNVEDITKKIIELSQNEELRIKLGKKALERSMDFSWEQFAEGMIDMLEIKNHSGENNYKKDYTYAFNRTIVTISQLHQEMDMINDLLQFDNTRILNWIKNNGFEHQDWKYYAIPFKDHILNMEKLKND